MITEDAILNFIPTRVSELVSVLPSLPWSQFKFRFRFPLRFRIPDSGFSIRPLKVSHSAEKCFQQDRGGVSEIFVYLYSGLKTSYRRSWPEKLDFPFSDIYPGVNQIPVTASVACDREELKKAGVSGY